MRIYTKTGDTGDTGLIGGQRVPKHHPRIDAYGTLDELNAALGLCTAAPSPSNPPAEISNRLRRVQNELFILGSRLAAPDPRSAASLPQLPAGAVAELESEIDAADALLPPLKNFILPTGTLLAAHLHLARTICRRAERAVVSLSHTHPDDPALPSTVTYLNRLSDWLFTHARLANHLANVPDIPWK